MVLRETDEAVRGNLQARASALVHRYGELGGSPDKVFALLRRYAVNEDLAAKKTRAFLVVRNDKIVYEWYAPGVTAASKQGTASLAKALVGGMSLAVAITDGKISICCSWCRG